LNKYIKPAKEFPPEQLVVPAFLFKAIQKELQQKEFLLNGKLFHSHWDLDSAENKVKLQAELIVELQATLQLCKRELLNFKLVDPNAYVKTTKLLEKINKNI
jgi:hypothetical protein